MNSAGILAGVPRHRGHRPRVSSKLDSDRPSEAGRLAAGAAGGGGGGPGHKTDGGGRSRGSRSGGGSFARTGAALRAMEGIAVAAAQQEAVLLLVGGDGDGEDDACAAHCGAGEGVRKSEWLFVWGGAAGKLARLWPMGRPTPGCLQSIMEV